MRFGATSVLALGAFALAGALAGTPAAAQQKSVAMLAIVEHPSLDAVRDGVKDSLKAAGFDPDKSLKWQYQSAQGNAATAAQIARKFIGDRPDAIVALGTPAAQAVAAATKDVPLVYAAITDPVAAKLVRDLGPSGTNITGTSDALPVEQQIKLIKQIAPAARRVGIVYNPGEANSVVVVKQLQEALPQAGLTLVEVAAPRTVDVGSAARSLIGKVDVIYSNTDNNVVAAFESLAKVANDAKIPLISADAGCVPRGAVAALGVNYRDLGQETGKIVVRILKGEKPGDIPAGSGRKFELVLNAKAAALQGVALSDALTKAAVRILK
jgi:putative ABC transport system substrate-binding protein